MPRSIARATASDRLPAPSLANTCAMCQFTVRSRMPSAAAISLDVSPRATCSRTSISRRDSDVPIAASRARSTRSNGPLNLLVLAKRCRFRHLFGWPSTEIRTGANRRSQQMKTHRPFSTAIALVFLAGLLAWATGPTTALAASTTFSGQATVVKGTVAGIAIGPLADTGPISPSGEAREATLLEYPIDNVPDPTDGALRAEVLHATVVAG